MYYMVSRYFFNVNVFIIIRYLHNWFMKLTQVFELNCLSIMLNENDNPIKYYIFVLNF